MYPGNEKALAWPWAAVVPGAGHTLASCVLLRKQRSGLIALRASIGALVGAIYCAGELDDLEDSSET